MSGLTRVKQNAGGRTLPSCRALISTVGLTKEPVQFSANRLNPEIIRLICTNESLHTANELRGELSAKSDCRLVVIGNGVEPSQVMMQIYKLWKELDNLGIQKHEIYVDGTGGTKPMAAGAMIAAAVLGLPNTYVEVKRDKDGHVIPGTMQIYEIPDPREVLTEYYADVGIAELNRWEFSSARSIFEKLQAETSNLVRRKLWEALMKLSDAYDSLDKFDHNGALLKLEDAIRSLKDYYRESRIHACEELLRSLEWFRGTLQKTAAAQGGLEGIFDLFENANRRFLQGRYDDAVARWYRTLEALAHLALQADCGYTEKEITDRELSLEKSYRELARHNHALGSKYSEEASGRFVGMLESRNKSILAHGWRPIPKETAVKFKAFIQSYVEMYCRMKNVNFEKALQGHGCPVLPQVSSLLYG